MRRPRGWFRGAPRWYLWVTGAAVVVALLLVVGAFFLDEPLRRLTERQMNERLKSHTATVGRLEFHPIGFAIDLRDVVLVQNANPDPPVMRIERLSANVQWTALIRGRLVADVELVRPVLHLDRNHLEAAKKDDVPVKDRGWQDALQAIYPSQDQHLRDPRRRGDLPRGGAVAPAAHEQDHGGCARYPQRALRRLAPTRHRCASRPWYSTVDERCSRVTPTSSRNPTWA